MSHSLLKQLQVVLAQFNKIDNKNNKNVVIIIGPPGSGKTEVFKFILTELNKNSEEILNTLDSVEPNVASVSAENMALIDTAGIDFSHDNILEPVFTFILWLGLRFFQGFKVLLVTSQSDLDSKYGKALGEMWKSFVSLFQPDEIKEKVLARNGLMFLVNKAPVENSKNTIMGLLENMKKKDQSKTSQELLCYLESRENIFIINHKREDSGLNCDPSFIKELKSSSFLDTSKFPLNLNQKDILKTYASNLKPASEQLADETSQKLCEFIEDFHRNFRQWENPLGSPLSEKYSQKQQSHENFEKSNSDSYLYSRNSSILQSNLEEPYERCGSENSLIESEEPVEKFKLLTKIFSLLYFMGTCEKGEINKERLTRISDIIEDLSKDQGNNIQQIQKDILILDFMVDIMGTVNGFHQQCKLEIMADIGRNLCRLIQNLLAISSLWDEGKKERKHSGSKNYFRGIVTTIEKYYDFIKMALEKYQEPLNFSPVVILQQLFFNCNYHLGKTYFMNREKNKTKQAILCLVKGVKGVNITDTFPAGKSLMLSLLWKIFLEHSELLKELSAGLDPAEWSGNSKWSSCIDEKNKNYVINILRDKFIQVLEKEVIKKKDELIQELRDSKDESLGIRYNILKTYDFLASFGKFNQDPAGSLNVLAKLKKDLDITLLEKLLNVCIFNDFPGVKDIIRLGYDEISEILGKQFREWIYCEQAIGPQIKKANEFQEFQEDEEPNKDETLILDKSLLSYLKIFISEFSTDEELEAVSLFIETTYEKKNSTLEKIQQFTKLLLICSQDDDELLSCKTSVFMKKSRFFNYGLYEETLAYLASVLLEEVCVNGNSDIISGIPEKVLRKTAQIFINPFERLISNLTNLIQSLEFEKAFAPETDLESEKLSLIVLWLDFNYADLEEIDPTILNFSTGKETIRFEYLITYDWRDRLIVKTLNIKGPIGVIYLKNLFIFLTKFLKFTGTASNSLIFLDGRDLDMLNNALNRIFIRLTDFLEFGNSPERNVENEKDFSMTLLIFERMLKIIGHSKPQNSYDQEVVIRNTEILKQIVKVLAILSSFAESNEAKVKVYEKAFKYSGELLKALSDQKNAFENDVVDCNSRYFETGSQLGSALIIEKQYEKAIAVFIKIKSFHLLKKTLGAALKSNRGANDSESLNICTIVAEAFFRWNLLEEAFKCYYKFLENCTKDPELVSKVYLQMAQLEERERPKNYFQKKARSIQSSCIIYSDDDV